MTNLTRLGKTLKVQTPIKTTYLPFGTFRISYDPLTLEATIYSVDTAAIVYDGVISDLYDVANSLAFTVPTLEVFITSFNFGDSGGGITDVTATAPLVSSGGSTPNISIDVKPDGVYGISFSSGVATLVTVGGNIVGEIKMFGTVTTPTNYVWCDGSLLPVATYPELFAVIGNSYGGDGVTTYQLPNLVGYLARGDNGGNIGTSSGSNSLTENQLPIVTVTGTIEVSENQGDIFGQTGAWISGSGRTDILANVLLFVEDGLQGSTISVSGFNANSFGNNEEHEHPYTTVRYAICVSV